MSGYSYSSPVPSAAPNIAPAPSAGGGAYVSYTSEVTQQILQADAEALPSNYVSYADSGKGAPAATATATPQSYTSYAPGQNDEIISTYMNLDGEANRTDARAEAIVQQAKLLELSTQHGQGPTWEKADPHHRIGELLIAAWEIYVAKPTSGPTIVGPKSQRDFFAWLDSIPEWDRVVMISQKIREMGAAVLGTPQQRQILKAEAPKMGMAGVHKELNLKPSIIKAFVRGVQYLDAASRPSYVVSFAGNRATYRGAPFDTSMMQTVFSGRGYGIWVMDGDATLYAGNHVYGQMHHSSFLSGGGILAGGEIRAKGGKIEFISGKSGHYTPPMESLIGALKKLQTFGIDLNTLRVLVWGTPASGSTAAKLVNGHVVINDGGKNFASWGFLSLAQKACLQAGRYDEFK